MCDAVQNESYKVDGVPVSNFLLPLYFTPDAEEGGRNDFLGRMYKGKRLASFGINPGGYIGFYNPRSGKHETFSLKADARARARLKIKAKASLTRRSMRHKAGTDIVELIREACSGQRKKSAATRAKASGTTATRASPSRAVEMIDQAPLRAGVGVD
jgi:hypothetical protein